MELSGAGKKETIIDVIDSLLNRSAKQKPIQKYQTLNCQDSYVKQIALSNEWLWFN